jgi:hypothetical protein
MASVLAIVHGLVAVALLGAITHQALATWAPAGSKPGSFFARFRSVKSDAFANAFVLLYALTAALGAIVYLDFKVDIAPDLERDGHWLALGCLDLKEDFVAIGLGLLPAYWVSWRRPETQAPDLSRSALTSLFAFIVWWSFLVGHVMVNIMGFGA